MLPSHQQERQFTKIHLLSQYQSLCIIIPIIKAIDVDAQLPPVRINFLINCKYGQYTTTILRVGSSARTGIKLLRGQRA